MVSATIAPDRISAARPAKRRLSTSPLPKARPARTVAGLAEADMNHEGDRADLDRDTMGGQAVRPDPPIITSVANEQPRLGQQGQSDRPARRKNLAERLPVGGAKTGQRAVSCFRSRCRPACSASASADHRLACRWRRFGRARDAQFRRAEVAEDQQPSSSAAFAIAPPSKPPEHDRRAVLQRRLKDGCAGTVITTAGAMPQPAMRR